MRSNEITGFFEYKNRDKTSVMVPKGSTIGEGTYIHPSAKILTRCVINPNSDRKMGMTEIMEDVEIEGYCHIMQAVILEKGVKLGVGVQIEAKTVIGEYSQLESAVGIGQAVKIGSYCKIGYAAVVSGVNLPDRSTLEARSIFTKPA